MRQKKKRKLEQGIPEHAQLDWFYPSGAVWRLPFHAVEYRKRVMVGIKDDHGWTVLEVRPCVLTPKIQELLINLCTARMQ